jgi:hypothetical protein
VSSLLLLVKVATSLLIKWALVAVTPVIIIVHYGLKNIKKNFHKFIQGTKKPASPTELEETGIT